MVHLFLLPAARGDDPAELPGESRAAAGRLAEAAKHAAAGRHADARAQYQAVLDAKGSDLAPLEGRLVAARRLAHAGLARLPAAELARYRDKVEAQAKAWLAEAERDDDPAPLVRLLDEAFCSRQAVAAADRLGDRAFLRGHFDEAEAWWRLIAPLVESKSADALAYPDAKEDTAARLRAKQLLARLFRDEPTFAADLAAFRKRHPKAKGALAGRSGAYADTLAAVAAARAKRAAAPNHDWPTFAGDAARRRPAADTPNLLDHLSQTCRAGPAYRFDLGARRLAAGAGAAAGTAVDDARRAAFHPALVGDLALVADARYITAYNLRTGAFANWYDADKENIGGLKPNLTLPAPADLRYTLTVAEGCVFARLGAQAISDIRPRGGEAPADGESILVCLSLAPGPDGERRRWMVRAVEPGRKEHAVFEGAPVVCNGRVYVAATRFENDRVVTAIHCYASQPEDTSPPLLWRVDVCSTRELLPASAEAADALKQRLRHHLLTVAGSRLVYASHSGAVVAVDARSGRRLWALRYPRRATEAEEEPLYRDLAPPLFAGGRLYVAPADSDRVMCLSPDTGEVVWEREGLDAVHLLGVGQGRLIFSTYRGPTLGQLTAGGLRAVRAADGSDEGGWSLPDDGGGLLPYGRGLLVGDLVLWPTVRRPFGVFAVRQADGLQPDNPALLHRVPAGNLLLSAGRLVVTDGRYLHAFVPAGQLPEGDDREVSSPWEMLRQATAAAARGDVERALGRLAAAEASGLARARQEVRRERERVLSAAARRAMATGEAEAWLRRWGPSAEGLVRVAGWWEEAGEKERARAAWEAIAAQPVLAAQVLPGPRRAGRVALAALVRLGGADEGLRRRWEQAPAAARAAALADLVRWFPGRAVTREALAESARRAETDDPAAAALHWARLAALAPGRRAEAAAGLGRVAAGVLECGDAGGALGVCLGRAVNRSEGPAPHPRKTPRAPPSSPHSRTPAAIDLTLAPNEVPLLIRDADRLWVAAPGALTCRSRDTGHVLWRRRLALTPAWAGVWGTIVLAGGAAGVAALDAFTGTELWRLTTPAPLTGWHLDGDTLLVVEANARLIALDALTGDPLWARHAPGAHLHGPRGAYRRVDMTPGRVIAQSPACLQMLDSRSGKVLTTLTRPIDHPPRPPVATGDDLLVTPGADEVVCLARADGARRWAFRPAGETTRTGDLPLAVPAGDSVLVVVPLNIGLQLHRLDRRTGKPLWRHPPLLDGDASPEAWRVVGQTVYHAAGELTALALADGKPLWRRPLAGAARWALGVTDGAVWAWPAAARGARFSFRWPGGTLQYQTGPLRHELALLCFDAKDGEVRQRVNLKLGPRRAHRLATTLPPSLVPLAGVAEEELAPCDLRVVADTRGLIITHAHRVLTLSPARSSN